MGGISSIIGAIALLGFLLFLAGVGLVVVSASQGRPVRGGVLIALVGLVLGVLLSVVSQGILVVEPQERAVVFQTLSGELLQPRAAGTHVIIPVLQESEIYDISQQEYTMSGQAEEGDRTGMDDAVEARTVDGQNVFLDITIIYSVADEGTAVNDLHRRWRQTYEENFVRPTVRGLARDVVSRFRAADIYGVRRAEMEAEMQQVVTDRFLEENLLVNDLLVRNIEFSDEFTDAIEQAQIAEQEAERARLQVERIRQEAEQARAQATGLRDARILEAQGEAEAVILNAQAQAEALRLVSEQIAANPSLILYEYVQQLSDNVQLALVPSDSPFLFDFQSIGSLPTGENIEVPEVPETERLVPEIGAETELDTETDTNQNNTGGN
jgi:regulator of protease activity HflC (stomatin/prohibitin superfamily)